MIGQVKGKERVERQGVYIDEDSWWEERKREWSRVDVEELDIATEETVQSRNCRLEI